MLPLLAALLTLAAVPATSQDGKDTRYNQQTVAIMRRIMAPDANGVDVGAFKGELTKPMVKIAPRGSHIAVEPQPAYANRLRQRFPQVRVIESALGEQSGTATFTQALDSPARSGFKRQEYPTDHERTRLITVTVERLDDLVTAGSPVAFIKIDVEGAEYQVLRGAMGTIQRDHPMIVFEYGRAGRKDYGVEPSMMWQLLHDELGLELGLMRTWLDGGPALSEAEFRHIVEMGTEWMFVAYPAPAAVTPPAADSATAAPGSRRRAHPMPIKPSLYVRHLLQPMARPIPDPVRLPRHLHQRRLDALIAQRAIPLLRLGHRCAMVCLARDHERRRTHILHA